MRHWKKVTEKEFKDLKAMLSLGLTPSKLRMVGATKRSDTVLSVVRRVKNFTEYTNLIHEEYKKYEKKPNGIGTAGTTATGMQIHTLPNEVVLQKLDRILELLESMQKSSTYIF